MDDRCHYFGTLLFCLTKQSLGNKDTLHFDALELWPDETILDPIQQPKFVQGIASAQIGANKARGP